VSIVVVVGWECRGYCEENVGVVNVRHGTNWRLKWSNMGQ